MNSVPVIPDEYLQALKTAKAPKIWINPDLLITVNAEMTLNQVLELLFDNDLLGAPVLNDQKNVLGFIDLLDIVTAFHSKFPVHFADSGPILGGISYHDFLVETTCDSIFNVSNRNPDFFLNQNLSVFEILARFAKTNFRHMAILNPKNELLSVISQGQLLRWLYEQHLTIGLGDLSKMTVAQLGLGSREVVYIHADELAMKGFAKMAATEKGGLPVCVDVEQGQRLVGNISATDLKSLGCEGELFGHLFRSTGDFLVHKSTTKAGTISVTAMDTLNTTLYKFIANKVHRIYIVDPDTQVLEGVITPNDIFRLFVKQSN